MCFWETFLDLIRILRPGGLLYVDAPSNSVFHRYPVDCWRFYPDSGVALVEWARRQGVEVELVESFVAAPAESGWCDFIAVFRKAGPPLVRTGRMADLGKVMNVHDVDCAELARESGPTFDMLARHELLGRLASLEAHAPRPRQRVIGSRARWRRLTTTSSERERGSGSCGRGRSD